MIKKLILLGGLLGLPSMSARATTWKGVLASTTGATQAGMSNYAPHLSSATWDQVNTDTATIRKQLTLTAGSTITASGTIIDSMNAVSHTGTHSFSTLSGSTTDNSTTTHTGSQTFNGTLNTNRISTASTSGGVAIRGSAAGDNALPGDYGEYFSTGNASAGVNRATNNAFEDIVSTTLAAGDWELTGFLTFDGNAEPKFRDLIWGISTTAGNNGAGMTYSVNKSEFQVYTSSIALVSVQTPTWRQTISSPTTYYLKYLALTISNNIIIYANLVCKRRR